MDPDPIDRKTHNFIIRFKKPLNDVIGFTMLEAIIPYTLIIIIA